MICLIAPIGMDILHSQKQIIGIGMEMERRYGCRPCRYADIADTLL